MPKDSDRDMPPLNGAFLERARGAVARLAATAGDEALRDALARPTDVGMLAALISRPEVVGSAVAELDPGAGGLAGEAAEREALLVRADGLAGADEVAGYLGISRQAVEKRRRTGALVAVRQSSDWGYPRCQFAEGEVLPGLPPIVRRLAPLGPWGTLRFLLSPNPGLSRRRPLDALAGGERASVSAEAESAALAGLAHEQIAKIG